MAENKKYGYIRVSSKGQAKDGNSLEAQERAVKDAGAQSVYTDVFTGTKTDRPELDKLLSTVSEGDTLIITKLDRISRSVQQGIGLINDLLEKGVKIHVINMGMMDDTPTGKLIRNIMLSFAEFERDMIMQRTREGKEISGRWGGRTPKYSDVRLRHAVSLLKTHSYNQVVEETGISKSTLQRAKKACQSGERLIQFDTATVYPNLNRPISLYHVGESLATEDYRPH